MALGSLAPIDRATLAYVAGALAFTLARGPRTWPAVVRLPLWLLDALAGAALAAVVLIVGRQAGYHSVFRSPRGGTDAHGEPS
jgi:hypothetical protein